MANHPSCLDKLQLPRGREAVPLPGGRGAGAEVWGKLQEHSAFHSPLILLMIAQIRAQSSEHTILLPCPFAIKTVPVPFLPRELLVLLSNLVTTTQYLSWADILPRQACLSLDRHLHSSHQDKGFLTGKNSKHTLS